MQRVFDVRPAAMIDRLGLWTDVISRETTNYGHSGRPGFSWES